ncbi:MAG: Na/Pi cotransporter family protein [Alphaproteobacteria bacterium]|nr:Na/Pi cotransporter family protein [Alphaproteobacteria bacterium]MBU0798541.1 Na/Pi cotransporter family protein [Alphaproteobacteria bacterium]MBU0885704.1 Na/Pi cotransporter family protein [Alphaproteobacteria bacterium]MBU1813777.1 Na/Pi cotransporter family protein [Alphaproteobacteria bacterium]MBU2089211.1 Na/Pi cotransporter family protein [Alphaproteobacteria bacterium]
MSATHILINLLGQIALLLWGIHMVQSGILRAFGATLRRTLSRGLDSPYKAFLAGFGVTAILQSSTATALMATSFAAGRIVDLVPALAIMLGANVGTTVIVQILAFDIALVSPVLILVGVIAFKRGGQTRVRDLGRVSVGLGLVLLALHLLTDTVIPTEIAPRTRDLIEMVTSDPIICVLAAAIFAWAAHASVAVVLLIISLAAVGIVDIPTALALTVGANLGTAINPLMQALGGDRVALRVPIGNLLNRIIGAALVLPFIGWIADLLPVLGEGAGRMVANFHTGFNLALALLFILPLPLIARLLERLVPERATPDDPSVPRHLDPGALPVPSIALTNAARESLRMADVVERMLRGSLEAFETGDRKQVARICAIDDILDRLHSATKHYLMRISREGLDEEQSQRLSEILAFTINLEHIGDIVDKNLMELADKKIRRQLSFSDEGLQEIREMHQRLLNHLQLSISVFMAGDLDSARRLVQEKEQFRELERLATERHFERLREGVPQTIETTELHLDIVRDLKRIESHIAATAYPLLEQSGGLRQSRLT